MIHANLNITKLPNGNLRLTAGNEARSELKRMVENSGYCDVAALHEAMRRSG